MLRRWFQSIFAEVVRKELKKQPLIVSYRSPNPDDIYEKGTMWKNGNDFYKAKSVSVEWEKI